MNTREYVYIHDPCHNQQGSLGFQEKNFELGGRKTTISFFSFFGASFFFPRNGVRVYNNLFQKMPGNNELLSRLRRRCCNLVDKDKVLKLIEKILDQVGYL